MAIEFACHQCGGHFSAPEQLAGKQAKCKRCGAVVTVPIILPAEPVRPTAPRPAVARPAQQPIRVRPLDDDLPNVSEPLPLDLLREPAPQLSSYTLRPAAAPSLNLLWPLALAACALVVLVSGVVVVGLAFAYIIPRGATTEDHAEQKVTPQYSPSPVVTKPEPPLPIEVAPALSNLPAPAETNLPTPIRPLDEEPAPVPALDSRWVARPDPPPTPITYKTGKISIPLPANVDLRLPNGPSQFILGKANDFNREVWQVFDLRTGKPIGKPILQRLEYDRRSEAFSPDGRYFAAMRRDADTNEFVISVWSFTTGEMTQALRMPGLHLSGPLCFAAAHQLVTLHNPDGQASLLTLWNLQTGGKIRELAVPRGTSKDPLRPESLAVSPGGRYATLIMGKQLGVIDLTTGQPAGVTLLPNEPWGVDGVAFSPDGAELAVLTHTFPSHRLQTFDFATGQIQLDHDYHERLPHFWYDGPTLDWLPDKSGLVFDGHLLLERGTGEEVWVFPTTDDNPRRVIREGQILVLLKGRNGKVLQTADLPEKEIAQAMQSIKSGGAAVDSVLPPLTTPNLFSATAALLPSGPTDWTYQTDNAGATPRGLEREVLVAKSGETIRRIGFASAESGKVVVQKEVTPRAAVGRRLPRRVVLERYDLASGDKGNTVEVPYVYQFADLSPSGKSVVVAFAQRGHSYERLDVLSLAPKKHVAAWRPYAGERAPDQGETSPRRPRTFGMSSSPQSVVWAALTDDDHVLTVNTAGKLICWRMPECQAVYVFEEFGEPLALSPGRRYLAGNHFGQFRIFDTRTGKCVGDLQSPQYGSRAVRGVFRSDGRELAALIDAGPDKMLARWDLKDGQLIAEFPVPPAAITGFSPFYTSSRGARLGIEYRGADHMMIDDQFLVDLKKQAVVWQYHVSGYFAVNSPDHRTWYCTRKPNSRDQSLFLTMHDTPSSMVQQKAAGVSVDQQLLLQPGMSVQVKIDLSGAGLSDAAPALEQAVIQGFEFRGVTVSPQAPLTFSIVAAQRSTGEEIKVHSGGALFFPRGEAKETFDRQELAFRMALSDSAGKVVWYLDEAVQMRNFGLVRVGQASEELRQEMLRGFQSKLGSAGQSVPRYVFADLKTIVAGESMLGFHQEGPPPEIKLPPGQEKQEKQPPGIAPGT